MGHIQKDKVTIEEMIYVIKNLHKPLLGRLYHSSETTEQN